MENLPRARILTGMRPTGRLHLGHYCGALQLWKTLAEQVTEYECIFLIADYQALGDNAENIDKIRDSVIQVTIDWLAVGLDPENAIFAVQSYIPEHAELTTLLSFITPQSWLDANPTLKEESNRLKGDQRTVGFMTYPISQVADILLPRAHRVPAGKDQEPHIELTRRVARRFNRTYNRELFPLPRLLLSETPRLVGIDGEGKMRKSLGNAIFLSDTSEEVAAKVRKMKTDATRLDANMPGKTEENTPFIYLDAFDPDKDGLSELKAQYRAGGVRDMTVKERLTQVLNSLLEPIRQRRLEVEQDLPLVKEILHQGSKKERVFAIETVEEVREAMRIRDY